MTLIACGARRRLAMQANLRKQLIWHGKELQKMVSCAVKLVKPDPETMLFKVNLFDIYVSKKVIDFCCDPQLHEKVIGGKNCR